MTSAVAEGVVVVSPLGRWLKRMMSAPPKDFLERGGSSNSSGAMRTPFSFIDSQRLWKVVLSKSQLSKPERALVSLRNLDLRMVLAMPWFSLTPPQSLRQAFSKKLSLLLLACTCRKH